MQPMSLREGEEEKEEKLKRGSTFDVNEPIDQARLDWAQCKKGHFLLFVSFTASLAVAEAILVAWTGSRPVLKGQITILAFSTLFFFVGLAITFSYLPKDDHELWGGTTPDLWVRVRCLFDMEVLLELFFILLGWSCITHAPGVAALRIIRVFRYLWYTELIAQDAEEGYKPEDHPFHIGKAASLCLGYLEQLVEEFCSDASKGGIVVMLMFFFITYAFALVMWIQLPNLETLEGHTCQKLSTCYIVMLRLALYDGTGLDYLSATVTENKHGYAALLILYLIISAIVLLNGLIGIFGQAFSADKDADEEEEKQKKEMQEKLNRCLELLEKLQVAQA